MLLPLLLALATVPDQDVEAPAWSRERTADLEGPHADAASAAIDAGLEWLRSSQADDGSWSDDPGTSALVVLAFAARNTGGGTLFRGIDHLAESVSETQDPRAGAILALALVEAAALGRDDLRDAASRALARFDEVPHADLTSPAFAWRSIAATLAAEAGIPGGPSLSDVRAELARRSRASGAVERSRGEPGDRFRGVGAILLARQLAGEKTDELSVAQAARLVDPRALPTWPEPDEGADLESWAWGAAALALRGGEEHDIYLGAVRRALLGGRTAAGSWPGVAGAGQGSEAATALAVLALAAPGRYSLPAPEPVAAAFEDAAPEKGRVIGIGGGRGGRFSGRFGSRRGARMPDGRALQRATESALAWLADAQHPDGHWIETDVGATALALLALQGDGNTLRHGPHKDAVIRGIKWLRDSQDQVTGRYGDGSDLDQALATAAMAEGYYFSKSPLLKRTLNLGLANLETRADTRDEVVAAWTATAVSQAVQAKAEVPGTLRAAVEARYAPGAALPEFIAPAVLLRALLHEAGPEGEWRSALAALEPSEATDPMDLFFGAYASFQVGDDVWEAWDAACRPVVLARIGDDGSAGGVRETALAVLTLEVYYRYARAIGGR